jgi:hypothetical protein
MFESNGQALKLVLETCALAAHDDIQLSNA